MVYDPNKFKQAAPAIISFDATDFADGTGIVTLFGVIQLTSTGTTYALTKSNAPSGGNPVLPQSTTYNFDLSPFNLPRTGKGTATFIAHINRTGANLAVTVTVQHVDGVTSAVTSISSAITSQSESNTNYKYNIPLPITEKHFKAGDILRCKVVTGAGGGSSVWCDPTGASGFPLQLLMPFRIPN